jgi:hypothetical protein
MKTKNLLLGIAILGLALNITGCGKKGVAGIDTPLSVSGVTLKFTSAELSTSALTLGSHSFSPDQGDYVLVVHGDYTGNFNALYEKIPYGGYLFYLSDAQGAKYKESGIAIGKSDPGLTVDIGFIIPITAEKPYLLQSDIGKSWSVDITSLVKIAETGSEGSIPSEMPSIEPTLTPQPTLIPTLARTGPTVGGIDSPVSVAGATLQFNAAAIFFTPTNFGNLVMTPRPGEFVLILQAIFTGDFDTLFGNNGIYISSKLYVSDAQGNKNPWWDAKPDKSSNSLDIVFVVKNTQAPYTLHSDVETPWSVNLTSLLPVNMPIIAGFYTGDEPTVFFTLSTSGIDGFYIYIPYGSDQTCKLGPLDHINVNPDGTFSLSLTVMPDSTQPDIVINGTINGNVVSGDYFDDVCGDATHWEKITPGYSGTWSANLRPY